MFSELGNLHAALSAYIEANYHISHPTLVDLRRAILDRPGTISQRAFIESTPIYRGERHFADLSNSRGGARFSGIVGRACERRPNI